METESRSWPREVGEQLHRAPADDASEDNMTGDKSKGDVGWGNPPSDHQFKKGQSGNPSGKRKKPKMPRHLGNQTDAISLEWIRELNKIMMEGMPTDKPSGRYIGATYFARALFRDAMTKDGGYARKRLLALYYDEKKHLEEFKPKDRGELEADQISEQMRLITDPRATDADLDRAFKRWAEELDDFET